MTNFERLKQLQAGDAAEVTIDGSPIALDVVTVAGKPVTQKTLYAECVARGIQTSNYYSDLYVPCTEETQALIKHFDTCRPSLFQNQVESGTWLDVPFAFTPFWDKLQAESERREALKLGIH